MGMMLGTRVRQWRRLRAAALVFASMLSAGVALKAQPTHAVSQHPTQFDSTNGAAENELQTGISLTRQGRFNEALPHLLAATQQGDHSFAAEFDLALCYVGTMQYEPGIKILNDLSTRNQENANVYSLLAQAYIGSDQIQDAVKALHKAAVLAPKNEKLYLFIGDACMERGHYSVGLDVVNLGLKNLSDSVGLLYQRGMFLTLLDQFDAGKLDLERAAQLGKGSEIAYLAAAQKATFEGNMAEVIRVTRVGIKNHESAALMTMLGEALIRSGISPGQTEYGEAVAAMEKSVNLRPDDPTSRIALGKLYLMGSRIEDAIASLEAARQLDPTNTAVYSNLAKAYRRRGDPAKAQEMLGMLSRLNQNQADTIRTAPGERKSSYLGSRSEQTQHSSQPTSRKPGEDQ